MITTNYDNDNDNVLHIPLPSLGARTVMKQEDVSTAQ